MDPVTVGGSDLCVKVRLRVKIKVPDKIRIRVRVHKASHLMGGEGPFIT